MELTSWMPYLIAVNFIGFWLFAADVLLHAYRSPIRLDPMVLGMALLGGTAGILLSMVFFSRRAHRETMLNRILLFCLLPVQAVVLLAVTGHVRRGPEEMALPLIPLMLILLGINALVFCVYLVDKYNAIHRLPRVPTVTLLLLTYLGAAPGALLAMYGFRHKTRQDAFRLGVPMMLAMQILVVTYLLYLPL